MLLQIKPHSINDYPLLGVLIKGDDPVEWVRQIQLMGLGISDKNTFPIPGTTPNSIWGCLVVLSNRDEVQAIGRNEYCQLIHNRLFIPERAILFPVMTAVELDQLLLKILHIFHPDFGLVKLDTPINWMELLTDPVENQVQVIRPAEGTFIPTTVKRFQVQSIAPEEVLRLLEEETFPKGEALKDAPLTPFEKTKLLLYRQFFGQEKNQDGKGGLGGLPMGLAVYLAQAFGKPSNWLEGMQEELESLEQRNQHKVNRLLDMFKNNPEEALKYALPLDQDGTTRGGSGGAFKLDQRWFDFSLFGSGGGSSGSNRGGGSANIGAHFWALKKQYEATAEQLIKEGKYRKAAFVYLKLLKNPRLAAQTLEQGQHYQEAASLYLKRLKDQVKAAECYEKGRCYQEAIELYKALENFEKVGDLYSLLQDREKANYYYLLVVEQCREKRQFFRASILYRDKINDLELAKAVLLEGWRLNVDPFSCLNNYFRYFEDETQRWEAINHIYRNEVGPNKQLIFLKVLKYEYRKANEWKAGIRDIAYEMLSELIKSNPHLVSELVAFNRKDQQLVKDTIRYTTNSTKG